LKVEAVSTPMLVRAAMLMLKLKLLVVTADMAVMLALVLAATVVTLAVEPVVVPLAVLQAAAVQQAMLAQ